MFLSSFIVAGFVCMCRVMCAWYGGNFQQIFWCYIVARLLMCVCVCVCVCARVYTTHIWGRNITQWGLSHVWTSHTTRKNETFHEVCHTVRHVTRMNESRHILDRDNPCMSERYHVVCCSVLQCVAVCCSVLQCFEWEVSHHETCHTYERATRGGGLGSRPIFKKFHETYAPS